jgi:hypothetical protein
MDFPKQPLVPLAGSPNYVSGKGDSQENHPVLQNTAPDSIQDWDMTPEIQHLLQNTAEREGISVDEAMRQLKGGCEDAGEYNKPRSESGDWTRWQGPDDS